jgi:hypothetical protein
MASERPDLGLEEYRGLRATIRQRGTARLFVTTITFVSWSALALAACTLFVIPAIGLIPLLMLAVGFEAVFALHVGVERIGRYLQVRYETPDGTPGWEHAAMRFGRQPGSTGGVDPLFAWPFSLAIILNLMIVLFMSGGSSSADIGSDLLTLESPPPLAFGIYAILHAVAVARVISARRFAKRQRESDLRVLGS